MCDIDIQGDIDPADEKLLTPEPEQAGTPEDAQQPQKAAEQTQERQDEAKPLAGQQESSRTAQPTKDSRALLATPAVRGLLKQLNVRIEDVQGTGRDGRVLKEDVHKFAVSRDTVGSNNTGAKSTGDDHC